MTSPGTRLAQGAVGAPVDLRGYIRPGDAVLWGQGSGEPRTLTEALVAQRADLGPLEVFLGASYSDTLHPEHADHLRLRAIGGLAANGPLARAGVLDVLPCHLSALPGLIATGRLPVDVVMVQVSPAGPDGTHSLGLVADYLRPAINRARVVIAEVNDQVPDTRGDCRVVSGELDLVVASSRPPVELADRPATSATDRIARLCAGLIPDGATVQLGIGGIAPAVARALRAHRDLGLHCGIVGDWLVGLHRSGALTNAAKRIDRGVTVTGAVTGTRVLYEFVHDNPAVALHPATYTHASSVLTRLGPLYAVNSALEVDLSGQVNAETLQGRHVGAIGGQVDFLRAAAASGGLSVVALTATARGGTVSRIVPRLADGVVTTPRSDVDVVVTEHGVADLRGASLTERARRLLAVADPAHRDALAEEVPRC